MAEGFEKDQDRLADGWMSSWEDQCADDWERETNMDDRSQSENEALSQSLWFSFQNSAEAISQLYKDGCNQNCVSLWVPFQNAASSVTNMYRDSVDVMKKNFDSGCQYGQARRTKDIISWAKKRRRNIRKEDLIAFLCGKNPPLRHKSGAVLTKSTSRNSIEKSSPRLHMPAASPSCQLERRDEPDLQPFRDALALQGLNGAMSNIGIRPTNGAEVDASSADGMDTFHTFILDEMSRRIDSRKRTNNTEVITDSPTRKRSRLI